MSLMDAVRNGSTYTQSVNLGLSLGKDSVCMLDLCCRNFKYVYPFFMHFVKGLKFQEDYIAYLENRYRVTVIRVPHWMLGTCYLAGCYRDTNSVTDQSCNITIKDVERYVAMETGTDWFCYGHMMCESLERNAMIKHSGQIDEIRHVIYPLAEWSPGKVIQYLQNRKIKLAPEYKYTKRSIGDLRPEYLDVMREHFPDDYETVKRIFPYVEAHHARKYFERIRKQSESLNT